MWGLTSLTNYKSLGQTLGCGRGCSYSLAPGDDSGVELTVGAPFTGHPHHQGQTKQLVIVLAIGLVRVLHLTHSVEWAYCIHDVIIIIICYYTHQ